MNQKIINFINDVVEVEIKQNNFREELEGCVQLIILNFENDHGEISPDQELTSNFAAMLIDEIEQWIMHTRDLDEEWQ